MHKKFRGHYGVGVAAVVVAETVRDAKTYLESGLEEHGLPQEIDARDFIELELRDGEYRILNDGNY